MKSTRKHSKCNQLSKSHYIVLSISLTLSPPLSPTLSLFNSAHPEKIEWSIADLLFEDYITILSCSLSTNYNIGRFILRSEGIEWMWKCSIDKRLIGESEFSARIYCHAFHTVSVSTTPIHFSSLIIIIIIMDRLICNKRNLEHFIPLSDCILDVSSALSSPDIKYKVYQM